MRTFDWLISEKQAEKIREFGFDSDNKLIVKLFEKSRGLILEPSLEMPSMEQFGPNYYHDYLDNPDKYIPLYTYEQVLSWFRENEIIGWVGNDIYSPEEGYYYIIRFRDLWYRTGFDERNLSYEEARDKMVNEMIRIYDNK
jgi:hypothetical protein